VNGNRAAGRKFALNESNVRDWRKQKAVLMETPGQKRARRGRRGECVTITLREKEDAH